MQEWQSRIERERRALGFAGNVSPSADACFRIPAGPAAIPSKIKMLARAASKGKDKSEG